MSQEIINIGTTPNSGNGDPLRTAFNKINSNFTELYTNVSALSNSVTSVAGRTGNIQLSIQDINGINSYLRITSVPPMTSKGIVGDTVKDVSIDSNYIYYCIETYTDGATDIWKRIEWGTDTW
jgi:hypothetical protein